MAVLADAFIALPKRSTSRRASQHGDSGSIDPLVDTKFLPAAHRHSISVDENPRALIHKLARYDRIDVPKTLWPKLGRRLK
ncbi:hypothetical protein CQ054_21590 [Ochrobactrum sp. MYb29]|nr:hypothetical protein CQ054_21590 [Ochrobactrum sp. MYb29]